MAFLSLNSHLMHVPTMSPFSSRLQLYDPGSQPTEHASFASHHASIITVIPVPIPGRWPLLGSTAIKVIPVATSKTGTLNL
jgi:hypothetical protein